MVKGIGEAHLSLKWGRWVHQKRRFAMRKLKEMSLAEFLGLCRMRMAKGKTKFSLYLPPYLIPPFNPFRKYETKDEITGVILRVFAKPEEKTGGWIIKVEVKEEPFNPPIPPKGIVVPFKPAA